MIRTTMNLIEKTDFAETLIEFVGRTRPDAEVANRAQESQVA